MHTETGGVEGDVRRNETGSVTLARRDWTARLLVLKLYWCGDVTKYLVGIIPTYKVSLRDVGNVKSQGPGTAKRDSQVTHV